MKRMLISLTLIAALAAGPVSAAASPPEDNVWLQRFDAYDTAQSAAYGGNGYVGPLPGFSYVPSELYGWDESYVLQGYMGAYQASKNTAYLDKFIEDFDGMTAQMEDENHDGYFSWWTSGYSTPLVLNGDMEKDSIYYKDGAGVYMTDGWYPYPWYGGKGTVYRTNAEKAGGTYSTMVQNNGKEFVAAYTILPTYSENQRYRVSFSGKNLSPGDSGKVLIVRQDTGQTIASYTFSSTKWSGYTFDFQSPEKPGVQLRVYLTNGDSTAAGMTTYFDNVSVLQYGEYIVHEGMVTTAVSDFVQTVESTEQLKKDYKQKAHEYLKLLEKNFAEHWQQQWSQWEENGVPMGVYRFPFDDTARMTQINEYAPFNEPSKGITLPHNWYAVAGRTLLNLYKATGKTEYLDKAVRMGNYLKRSLRTVTTNSGPAYTWDYWTPSSQLWDFGYFRYKMEDLSHANMELGFAVDLYKAGQVFTKDDMQAFANTFKELIWNKDMANPNVTEYVNGTGSKAYSALISEWLTLGQFDPAVKDISVAILNKPKDTFGPTYGMILIGNLLKSYPELLSQPQ